MGNRYKILLLIPHLGGGGAERVIAILASRLNQDKYDVHLGVVTGKAEPAESTPADVEVHYLCAPRVREGAQPIMRLVRQVHPDLILSGMAHLNLAVLMLQPMFPGKIHVVVRQNSVPSSNDAGHLTPLLYRMLYHRADAVICQTQTMAEAVAQAEGSNANVCILTNPVNVEAVRAREHLHDSYWNGPGPHLLAIGRLAPEKGFDLLLCAMASLRRSYPTIDLTILGAGGEEKRLTEQRKQLSLDDTVRFAGYVPDPETWFGGASMFVLPSRREGLPNALLEAAAAGLPIVATPALGGLSETLSGKEGVWLAREVASNALANSIRFALDTLQPGQRFPHAWIDDHRPEKVIAQYEDLIDSILAGAA